MLLSRIKSFAWRLGVAIVVFVCEYLVENLTGLGLPLWSQGIIILGLGEVTKWLNKNHQLKKNTQPVPEYKAGT